MDRINPYEMGSKKKLTLKQCSFKMLAIRILDIDWDGNEETYGNLTKEDENKVNGLLDKIEQSFYKSGGYIDQLKDNLNLDVKKYLKGKNSHKREVYKILYFVYQLKEKYGQKVLNIFCNPSMEDADDYGLNMKLYNTNIIAYIKSQLEKELKFEFVKLIREHIVNLSLRQDKFLNDIRFKADVCFAFGKQPDITKFIDWIKNNWDGVYCDLSRTEILSPMEDFYFKILQKENVGRISDIIKINTADLGSCNDAPQGMLDGYKDLYHREILFDDIDAIIEKDIDRLAQYIYVKNKVTSKEKKKILRHKHKIKKVIEHILWPEKNMNNDEVKNELFIVSCMQAILLSEDEESFSYSFWGYQNHFNYKPTVQSVLKNDIVAPEILRRYWQRRVMDYFYANQGKSSLRCQLRALDTLCDNIALQIYSCAHPNDMAKSFDKYNEILKSVSEQMRDECTWGYLEYTRPNLYDY